MSSKIRKQHFQQSKKTLTIHFQLVITRFDQKNRDITKRIFFK